MYSPLQLALKFISYWRKASNGKGHGIHSPFVFDFVQNVLNGSKDPSLYTNIESRRKALLKDETSITVEDFGAGSRVNGGRQRKIRQIAATSLKPKKYGQLLHRIARHYRPSTIVEIGTSLGITSSYLAAGNREAQLFTLEGASEVAAVAKQNFHLLALKNIEQIGGNFDETLPRLVSSIDKIDLAFIDGNHRFEPTIRYFDQVLSKSHDDTIIILDDIYWSREMEHAWQWVKNHEQTRLTIDLFAVGIVVFRAGIHHKQHFIIRY